MKKLQTIIFILFSLHLSSQDNMPPEIVSFDLSPQVIDVTDGSQAVTFTIGATDDISGVNSITIFIELSGGNGTNASNETLISGTIQDRVWELDETFSEFTDSGTANISMIWFFDVAGNISLFEDVELQGLGFDIDFNIDFEILNNNTLSVEWYQQLKVENGNKLT